jgi:RNA polymerase sigma-70 factor, ECF subfamily
VAAPHVDLPHIEPEFDAVERASGPALTFERVYSEHFEFVWRSLRLFGVHPGSLEDATQETFSVVARRLPDFAARSSVRTWLFGIAQRVAQNQRRSFRRKVAPLQPLEHSPPSAGPSPEASAQAAQAAALLERFAAELDEEWRTVFVLGLVEGVAAPELAALLELPVNTIYSRIRALRQQLRERLSSHGT